MLDDQNGLKEVNKSFDKLVRLRGYLSEIIKLSYFEKLINKDVHGQLMTSLDTGCGVYFKAYEGSQDLNIFLE